MTYSLAMAVGYGVLVLFVYVVVHGMVRKAMAQHLAEGRQSEGEGR